MEELTLPAATKKYGALIPPHVKITTYKPKSHPKSANTTLFSQAGDELLGVPDKHELFNYDYENYKVAALQTRRRRRRGHGRTKKMKKTQTNKSSSSK